MSGRRGPLSFLDTEWRTALWRRWVTTRLIAQVESPQPAPCAATDAQDPPPLATPNFSIPSPAEAPRASAEDASNRAREMITSEDVLKAARAVPNRASAAASDRNERRSDVRARFEALSARLQALEDAIDVIARRLSQQAQRERRTDRRTAELVERIAETVEAEAVALEKVSAVLERLERRVERMERVERVERQPVRDDSERRESRVPRARASEPERSIHPPRLDHTGDFSVSREPSDEEEASISGSAIRGSIGDMSLSTVLAMLEIERRSGRLKVQGDDGALIAFELEDGSVVGSRASENDVDPVESLRAVLTWKNGRFWFRQNPSESQVAPPRSVNSLLLEATRQIDEALRAG